MRCSSPWNRKCINNADILGFCPCIALTLRDRTRIVERLMGTSTERRALSYLKKGVLSVETNDQGERYLLHQCAAFSHRQSEVRLSLTESGKLVCSAHYLSAESVPRTVAVPVCPIIACRIFCGILLFETVVHIMQRS